MKTRSRLLFVTINAAMLCLLLLAGIPGAQAQEDTAGVRKEGKSVSPPVVLNAPEPEFSEEARRKHKSGTVQVTLNVGEDGLPRDVRVTRGFGYGLDEAAVAAVKQYVFKPAMENGVPVVVELKVEVSFSFYRKR